MPMFEASLQLPPCPSEVFSFFLDPKNLERLAVPELNLRLVSGPEVLRLGSVLRWQGKRWHLSHEIETEIVQLETPSVIVEEQRRGPLAKWVHERRFASHREGTLLVERVDFEPPGGILGLTIKAATVEQELVRMFAYRKEKLLEIFAC